MIGAIFAREWTVWRREGRATALFVALVVLGVAAFGAGLTHARSWARDAEAAQSQDRELWLAQGNKNQHIAAHFGQYAFKPAGALSFFDPGVNDYMGRGIWMEAHNQNPATLRAAEDGSALSRFGRLSAAWVLQLGLPLAIILAGFASFAGERESGTLRLQLAAGAGGMQLLAGKAASLLVFTALAWLGIALPLLALATDHARALLAACVYALYALAYIGMTLAVSAVSRTARSSLAILLAIWVITTLLVPRIAADTAETLHPSPDPSAFWSGVRDDQEKGINGHSSDDERAKQLMAETLAKYGVKDEKDLPVSFAGIALQAGEEYGNQVYDRYFGQLWQTYAAQEQAQLLFGITSPLLPLQILSQAASATDWHHHRQFATAAEAHRRQLEKFLNDEFTRSAKGKDFDFKATSDTWARAPQWVYAPPALQQVGAPLGAALFALVLWASCAWLAAFATTRRLVRQVAA